MASKKPKGLGLGLEALLGPKVGEIAAPDAQRPATLKLDQLRSGKYQPRTRMYEGALYELAKSTPRAASPAPVSAPHASHTFSPFRPAVPEFRRT